MRRPIAPILAVALLVPLALADEKPVAELENDLRKVRGAGDWPAVIELADHVIARKDASKVTRSFAKVCRWTALANTLEDFDEIEAAAQRIEDDEDMDPFWHMQVFLEQSQCYGRFKEYELAIEKAETGIDLVRDMLEAGGAKHLYDRIQLMTTAQCAALRSLGENDDCAEAAVALFEEHDEEKIPIRGGMCFSLLNYVDGSQDDDMMVEAAAQAVRAAARTGKPAELLALIDRIDRFKLDTREDADDDSFADLRKALMEVRDALKNVEDKDKEAAQAAADKAEAFAKNF